jgi:prevent-host-death family protein
MTMVFDHGTICRMDDIPISKFKATCLAVLEEVRRTRRPIRVTRFGTPVAEIVPPSAEKRARSWLGVMKGSGRIAADIVRPAAEPRDWEVLSK